MIVNGVNIFVEWIVVVSYGIAILVQLLGAMLRIKIAHKTWLIICILVGIFAYTVFIFKEWPSGSTKIWLLNAVGLLLASSLLNISGKSYKAAAEFRKISKSEKR